MILKTRATVLRWWPYKNTSRIVCWLTDRQGIVTTMIKGSQRPHSFFLGQYDLFYTCELLFYWRPGTDMFTIKECYPLNQRTHLRTNCAATAAASYFSDLIYRLNLPGLPHRDLFTFLNARLDELQHTHITPALIFRFELELLQHLGHSPQLNRCTRCGSIVRPADGPCAISIQQGGVVCRNCLPHENPSPTPLQPDVLATLQALNTSFSLPSIRNLFLSTLQENTIRSLLGHFLEHHLDVPPTNRRAAFQTLKQLSG